VSKQPNYSPAYKTKTRQKYSLYIDDVDLNELKAYEKNVGVPVSESIRRAISCYLQSLQRSSNRLPTLVVATKLKR
jgi:Ribbon-helix-helix domain